MRNPLEMCQQVSFPAYDKSWLQTCAALREATVKLREAYYAQCPSRDKVYRTPFGGPISDSIGPWPEFILRGLPCQKSKRGCCTPCFYSRIPRVNLKDEQIYDSLLGQADYILANFESLVVGNQRGPVTFPQGPQASTSDTPAALVLTPTGSFFDQREFPFAVSIPILTKLLDHSRSIKRPLALHVETHAEDLAFAKSLKDYPKLMDLLRQLNGRVLLGFESANEFVRNVLYNKYLPGDDFKRAAKTVKDAKLGVGAFVFTGINPLSDIEVIADAKGTLDFLRSEGITPVVMFHNVQPYTIQELLFTYKAHHLPEPRTVLEILKYLVQTFPERTHGPIDPWLIADPVGGPPPPKYNIFAAHGSATCLDCSNAIHSAIVTLRTSRHPETLLGTYEKLQQCDCAKRFQEKLEAQLQNNAALAQRVKAMMTRISEKLADFINVVRPIINETEDYSVFEDPMADNTSPLQGIDYSQLKAELLCHGLRIEPACEPDLVAFNSYMKEAGFVHAAHFVVAGGVINACVAENFCNSSPYLLTKADTKYQLLRDGKKITQCDVLSLPAWCSQALNGNTLGDVLRPHSGNVISGMPDTNCCYFAKGEGCRFCSLAALQNKPRFPAQLVADATILALEHNPKYELALSGGTPDTPDKGANYFAEIAAAVTKKKAIPISAELAPPDTDSHLDHLHDAGITSVIMNIEIWDKTLRQMFCPGKSRIPIDRYLQAIEHAVKVFGAGQVASVFIAGLQAPQVLLEGARAVIDLGAIPTIIPFKPFDQCAMAGYPKANPQDVLYIHRELSAILVRKGLNPTLQKGCTGCGGCSLETVTFRHHLQTNYENHRN